MRSLNQSVVLYGIFLLGWSPFLLPAQAYFTAGGVRLGTENGLTLQQRIAKKTTIEVFALSGFKTNTVTLGAGIQQHYNFLVRNLNIYTGVGMVYQKFSLDEVDSKHYSGAYFVGGLELAIGRFNLAWDWKPTLYFRTDDRSFSSISGIAIRYVFIRNKDAKRFFKKQDKNKRRKQRARKNRK